MYHVCKSVDTESLRRAGVELVIIGNGSHGMIKSYKSQSYRSIVLGKQLIS